MATHSSILAWEIPWTEEPGGLQLVHGVAELDMTEQSSMYVFICGKEYLKQFQEKSKTHIFSYNAI